MKWLIIFLFLRLALNLSGSRANICVFLNEEPLAECHDTSLPINYSRQSFPLYGFNDLRFNLLGSSAQSRPFLPFRLIITLPRPQSFYRIVSVPPPVYIDGQTVIYASENGDYSNSLMIQPNTGSYHWLSRVLDVLIILSLVYHFFSSFRTFLPLLAFALHGTFLPYCLILAPYLVFTKNSKVLLIIFTVFAFSAAIRLGCYSCHEILQPGSDQLTYESYARDILSGSFWAAGEPGSVFYYTPLYRYFVALFHLLGGESLWPIRFFGFLIYQFTWLALSRLITRLFSKSTALFSLWILAVLDKLPQLGLLFMFKDYYSESLGLSFLLFALYFFLNKHFSLSGLFLGLSVGVRPNYFPVIVAFFNLRLLLTFSLPILFVMLRNFIVAGQWQFFNSSGASTLTPGLVEILYHGQKETNVSNLFFQILSRPLQIMVPLWNNFKTMIGMPDLGYLSHRSLPAGINIPHNSWVYFPIWAAGIINIFKNKLSKEKFIWLSVPGLIFVTNLPFGTYFNGSAKYFIYVLFLLPFAVELVGASFFRFNKS